MAKTKKSFILSLLSLMLCIAMLIGTTYAWFTDSVTSGRNKIIAGNLDVELFHGKTLPVEQTNANKVSGATNLFHIDYWEPGVVAWENFTVANVGTLALKYQLLLRAWDFNLTDEGKDLTDVIKVATVPGGIKPLTGADEVTREQVQALSFSDNFENYEESGELLPGENGTSTFGVVLYWEPTDHDNDYNMNNGRKSSDGQPLFLEIGIDLVATQLQEEADSFDNTYDRLAEFPSIAPRFNAYGEENTTRNNNGVSAEDITIKIIKIDKDGGEIGEVTVSDESANKVMDELFSELPPKTTVDDALVEDDLLLKVKVETKDSTTDSIKLDISMFANATRTTTDKNGNKTVQSKDNQPITELSEPVVIPLQLERGLTNVQITHSHEGADPVVLTPVTSEEDVTTGTFYYNDESGELYVMTDKFSEFDIKYTREAVASVNGTTYTTLDEAIDNVKDGGTVEILKDTDKNANTDGKDFNLTMNDDLKVSNVFVDKDSKITLNGSGTFYSTVEGELNIVGGKYDDIEFNGNGKISVTNATVEKLVTIEGSTVKLDVIGTKVVKGVLNGKPTLTIKEGRFESLDVAHPEEVNLDVTGGTFHLEGEGEKEKLEQQLGDDMYIYETGEDGWYGISACTYEPLDAFKHNLRYKAGNESKVEAKDHEFDENDVCKKCGFSAHVGKVQIHTYSNSDYVCITDDGMKDINGDTVTSILGGNMVYDSGSKVLKLMNDVSVGQIDFTCDKHGRCGIILDLNGYILTANSWTALDIYANAKAGDEYGYEGYSLTINDSNPKASHPGYITYYKNAYSWITADERDNAVQAGKQIVTEYPISGGIITNLNGNKYGDYNPGDPYDGGIISTVGNTILTMNGGTLAATRSNGDIGGICMNRSFSTLCKLTMNNNAGVVGCCAAAGGVECCGAVFTMNDNAHISYCTAGNGGNYPGGAVQMYGNYQSTFTMNDNCRIDHCISHDGGGGYDGDSAVVHVSGGKVTLNSGTVEACKGRTMFWGNDGSLVINDVTFKDCVCTGAMSCWQMDGPLTINEGAEFINCTCGWNKLFDQNDRPTFINGGDFTKVSDSYTQMFGSDAKVVITGGKYTIARKAWVEAHLADGYKTVDIDADTFKVVEK